MGTKLTLRLDQQLIRRAKQHAKRSGKSLSQVVAEYFGMLQQGSQNPEPLPPTVKRLRGILAGEKASSDDYHDYLERKYR